MSPLSRLRPSQAADEALRGNGDRLGGGGGGADVGSGSAAAAVFLSVAKSGVDISILSRRACCFFVTGAVLKSDSKAAATAGPLTVWRRGASDDGSGSGSLHDIVVWVT